MSGPVKVSEAVSLALHATVFLASRPDRPVSTRDIAHALGASEAHLSKVLQRLAKVGLVRSTVGPCGGFVLGKPGNKITLLNVYETIEGPAQPLKCLFEHPVCAGDRCIFGALLKEVDMRLWRWLANTKLSEVSDVFADLVA